MGDGLTLAELQEQVRLLAEAVREGLAYGNSGDIARAAHTARQIERRLGSRYERHIDGQTDG